jgi:hypothetical protein
MWGGNLSERSVKKIFFGGGEQCALLSENPPMGKIFLKEV